jgi:Holliday junction resolvasome RuvABC endonuclease subunit
MAIDASSKSSGWSVFEDGKLIDYGCITASSTDLIKRIQKMIEGFDSVLNKYQINKLIAEEVRPDTGYNSNTNVWKALTWLQAAIAFLVHEKYSQTEIEYIYPSSWRSKIGIKTGKGIKRETLKEADIRYVKENFNIEVNDDIADAICINCSFWRENKNEPESAW